MVGKLKGQMTHRALLKVSGQMTSKTSLKGNVQIHEDGGTGTFDYESLINKPRIENVELQGNKSFEDLGLSEVTNQQILSLFR